MPIKISSQLPIISLMGPTGTGKTDLALELYNLLPCEIISVDSAMVYQHMNIGTAKPARPILKKYIHHLIDIRSPIENYSLGEFCSDANAIIQSCLERAKIPLLVGGTMLYFYSLQNGLAQLPPSDPIVRAHIMKELESQGLNYLFMRLKQVDPQASLRIKSNDCQRILRALEVFDITGKPIDYFWRKIKFTPIFSNRLINIALVPKKRDMLYDKINQRFIDMLKNGLIDEVQTLLKNLKLDPQCNALKALGYRQTVQFLQQKLSLVELKNLGSTATRHLAKRQLTWLNKWNDLIILSMEDSGNAQKISKLL